MLLVHPITYLAAGLLTLRRCHINLIHISLYTDMILRLRKIGQQACRFDVLKPVCFYKFEDPVL